MQQRFSRRVVAVVAGAGFGKSTLLAQAVAESRMAGQGRDVWIGCTPDHRAASVLVEDLLTGLGVDLPVDLPTEPDAASRLVADAVWGQAPTQVALVVDDAQFLAADSAGQAVIAALIEALPGNGHLVLASRPPLPFGLSRLLAGGSGVRLEEVDLAFADGELGQFADSRGVPLELLDGISGWPALAELIATTGRRQVADYLWEEVLATLTPPRRQMLTVLAAAGACDADVVGELLGHPVDLEDMLGDVPLVSTVDGRWSVHPLWQSALRSGLTDPTVAAAVAAAPAALRRRGMLRQSMGLLLESGAWPQVQELAVQVCSGISPAVGLDVLGAWLHRLPQDVLTSPAGRLMSATVSTGTDPQAARELLDAAVTAFRDADDVAGEMACLVSLFHIAFWHNELAAMLPILARWQELERRGVADAAHAASLGRALLADRPAAVQAELSRLPVSSSGPITVLVDWIRAHLLLLTLGEPERAVSWAREALPLAPPTLRSSIRCELVEGMRLLGEVEAARDQAAVLLSELQAASVRSPRHLVVPIVLSAFLGERERAEELLTQLRTVAETSPLPWAALTALIAEAAVAAGEDDERAAAALARLRTHRMAMPLVLLRISPASLVLQYVLDESSRRTWEETELLGCLASMRRLARAVTALREGGADAAGDAVEQLEEKDLQAVVGGLPVGWLVPLAVALAAAGRDAGQQLVQRLGPLARPRLRGVEESAGPLATTARRLLSVVPSSPQHDLRIEVLGPLRLVRDGAEVDDPHLRRLRVRQLLGYLVVHRQASRHQLTAQLWPDLEEADAARNLRVTLNYVQRVLEPSRDERDAPFFLRAKGNQLELVEDEALEVDLRAFERDLDEAARAEAQGTPSLALAAYLRAGERYGGDLLAGTEAEGWLELERDRVRRRCLRAVLRAGQLLLAAGQGDRAEDIALRALSVDDASEEAHRIMVAALIQQGDRAAAQRALDRLFDTLDELDLVASPAVFELAEQLRTGAGVTGTHPVWP